MIDLIYQFKSTGMTINIVKPVIVTGKVSDCFWCPEANMSWILKPLLVTKIGMRYDRDSYFKYAIVNKNSINFIE